MVAMPNTVMPMLLSLGVIFFATSCTTVTRLQEIGDPPKISEVPLPLATKQKPPRYLAPPPPRQLANSLWSPGARSFLKDQRAAREGDIVTINITITDSASITNSFGRDQSAEITAGAPNILGLESQLDRILPNAVNPSALANLSSTGSNQNNGSVARGENINLKVAAIVSQVLTNGNLVILGKQEVRVNYELRDLEVLGIIRPEDIASDNTIAFDKIAEARISYGGRGVLDDVQKPRWGQQLYDLVWPF